MRIGIITMHAARNYGAVLQTYALQEVLKKKFNAEPFIINYISTQRKNSRYFFKVADKYKRSKIKSLAFIIGAFPTRAYSQKIFSSFLKRYLYVDKMKAYNIRELSRNKYDADIFCVGSDQVWNPNHNDGIDEGFYLKFVKNGKKKISYASSIATTDIRPTDLKKMKDLLMSFSEISYREISSKKLFNEMNIEASLVLDPTFLLTANDWLQFVEKNNSCKKIKYRNYLLLYWFGNPHSVMDKVKSIARERNLKIVRISTVLKRYKEDEVVEYLPSPEQFVNLFYNANFVVTDSFHGTAFSINFNKQFFSCPAQDNDDRFYSLFEMFNLYDKDLLEEKCKLSDTDIKYDKVNNRLEEMRKTSMEYLCKSINN